MPLREGRAFCLALNSIDSLHDNDAQWLKQIHAVLANSV